MSGTSGKTAVLAFSGGLDTSYCAVWLREQGYRVVTVTVDTGGFSAAEAQAIAARAAELGVAEHHTLDARRELFDRYLRFLLYANARRGAGYPLCVSAERVCQALGSAQFALACGADALAHGSTGAGNDQVRFDTVFSVVAPGLELLTPIRSQGLSRAAESAYLRERGFGVEEKTEKYSVNRGMWGATVGGVETHGSALPLPDAAWPAALGIREGEPQRAPLSSPDGRPETAALLQPASVAIGFVQGVPASLDGAALDPVAIIERLAELGEARGIGRGMHLGDTILGIKGRVGYSAPAAHILIEAHRELEKLTLSAKQQFWKETLGNLYGTLVHEAQYLDPLARDLEALLESSQACVTGEVRVRLEHGQCRVLGCDSPYSLMALQPAAYGEEHRGWSGAEAAAFNRIYAQQQRLCWLQRSSGGHRAAEPPAGAELAQPGRGDPADRPRALRSSAPTEGEAGASSSPTEEATP
jgi:argininosuccinate synthase